MLEEGSLSYGYTLVLRQRLQPQWTLARVSSVFYGGSNRATAMLDKWQGSELELKEVLVLNELASFEWAERVCTAEVVVLAGFAHGHTQQLQQYVERRKVVPLSCSVSPQEPLLPSLSLFHALSFLCLH